MAASNPVYSSAVGPAKWAAVIALSGLAGAGLMYSWGRTPRRSEAAAALVEPERRGSSRAAGAGRAAELGRVPVSAMAVGGAAPAIASDSLPLQTRPVPPGVVGGPLGDVGPAAAMPTPAAIPAATPPVPTSPSPAAPASGGVPPSTPPPPAADTTPRRGKLINLNTAGSAELELLPRVGPALAQRIIDYRVAHGPFRSVAELDKVKGIGPKTLEKLAGLVTVE